MYRWLYLPTGKKAHAMGSFGSALCGVSPRWNDPIGWKEKGVDKLEHCKRCMKLSQ